MCELLHEYHCCVAVDKDTLIGDNICDDCTCREEVEEYQAFCRMVFRDERLHDGNIKKLRVTGNHQLLETELEHWLGDE